MEKSDDSESAYVLFAVFAIAVITLIFCGFMYSQAIEFYRETFGEEYITKRGLFSGTYQELKFLWPTDLGVKIIFYRILGPSLAFFVGYSVLARVALMVANGLGIILATVLGKDQSHYLIGGNDKYQFAVIWPLAMLWIAYMILAIIFVTIFKLIW